MVSESIHWNMLATTRKRAFVLYKSLPVSNTYATPTQCLGNTYATRGCFSNGYIFPEIKNFIV